MVHGGSKGKGGWCCCGSVCSDGPSCEVVLLSLGVISSSFFLFLIFENWLGV